MRRDNRGVSIGITVTREHCAREFACPRIVCVKHVTRRRGAIGPFPDGSLRECMKTGGPKFHANDAARALEANAVRTAHHTHDHGASVFDLQVNARIQQRCSIACIARDTSHATTI